ncbi:hypothetical protein GCM10010129_73490 [Streptomyces fumigatiscleroticus]|nr:hypothetical protein GCM10010129_73490 [Streptomyces fumigatiscleroticus]
MNAVTAATLPSSTQCMCGAAPFGTDSADPVRAGAVTAPAVSAPQPGLSGLRMRIGYFASRRSPPTGVLPLTPSWHGQGEPSLTTETEPPVHTYAILTVLARR